MLIRDFIPGEETELRRVFMSSVHTLARDFYTEEQLNAWASAACDQQKWASKIIAMRPFVATVEGQIAGYADLQASGYIDHFFVSGDFSGQGIGSALMQHLHEVAARRGLSQLSAQVSLSAESFFIKHGFLVDERQTALVMGTPLANARMSKALLADNSFKPTPLCSTAWVTY
ncbi:acetyltransferase [Betaproteobacteria bacterium]|nr:acetyltransferase [Betaproteobacteria bacterium]GHU03057.1 acetyltransferase [Betaproteobacteria bacterium]GHU23878.1 acetyltransferase [Betaproteobacteria bacterium]